MPAFSRLALDENLRALNGVFLIARGLSHVLPWIPAFAGMTSMMMAPGRNVLAVLAATMPALPIGRFHMRPPCEHAAEYGKSHASMIYFPRPGIPPVQGVRISSRSKMRGPNGAIRGRKKHILLAFKNTPFRARGFSSRARRKNAGIVGLCQVFTTQLSTKRRAP